MTIDYRTIAQGGAQFLYCPRCRGTLRDRTDAINDRLRPTCADCGWIYYPANLYGALVVAEDDHSLLVIYPPDTSDRGAALPGGIAEYGETPEECAQ